jgi:hypothetical protein
MQPIPTTREKLARVLNEEFKRIVQREEISMEYLVIETASLIQRSVRHIYNYRTGKWPFDPAFIPIFCRRFGSRALLDALASECSEVQIEVPENYDLTRMVSVTVRQDLEFYEEYLRAFESDGVQPHELPRLRGLMERVVHNAYQFWEIAAADCDRRRHHRFDRGSNQRSSTDHSKDHNGLSKDQSQTSLNRTLAVDGSV